MTEPIENVWQRARAMAFWDQGKYTSNAWRKDIKAAHPHVLAQSVHYMRTADFIALMERKKFIQSWPALRTQADLYEPKRVILDAAWSNFVVGAVGISVRASITRFHPKKRMVLRTLANSDGTQSIYALAKATGRNPRRVYDDVHDFVQEGLVVLEATIRDGKRTLIPKLINCHVFEKATKMLTGPSD